MLHALKDKKVANINLILEAFPFETQLWIVSEYCEGGSLTTLMKAYNQKLEERFIIPIAREVLIGLQSIHAANIVHRDVKCGNILIRQDGQPQLCDFGISAALQADINGNMKRSTIIGTPHWMSPEVVAHITSMSSSVEYSTEVDIWAFGITLIEMATGRPPMPTVKVENLGYAIEQSTPRLDGDFSPELKDLVASCLKKRPRDRLTAAELLEHRYIQNSSQTHPNSTLVQMIEDFYNWQNAGGQRKSLFTSFGAPATDQTLPSIITSDDDWNFNITEDLERRLSRMPSIIIPEPGMEPSRFDKLLEENRIRRGEHALNRIYDLSSTGYDPTIEPPLALPFRSDLPFRNNAPDRTTMIEIDLDAVIPIPEPNLNLADPPSLRGRRSNIEEDDETLHPNNNDRNSRNIGSRRTMDWKFPDPLQYSDTARRLRNDSGAGGPSGSQTARSRPKTQDWKFPTFEEMAAVSEPTSPVGPSTPEGGGGLPSRPSLQHSQTMPVPTLEFPSTESSRASSPNRASLIDLDTALVTELPTTRPSTAGSATNSAVSETTIGDPFDLEDQIAAPTVPAARRPESDASTDRGSFHRQSQSEPTLTGWNKQILATVAGTVRGSQIQSTQQKQDAGARESRGKKGIVTATELGLPEMNMALLMPGCSKGLFKQEIGRMSDDVLQRCAVGRDAWVSASGRIGSNGVKRSDGGSGGRS